MSIKEHADALLRSTTTARAVPGVAAIATTAVSSVYEGAFGDRVLGGDAEMTTDTVGRIASMTKPVTGAAVMQLVEQGQLELDVPAREVLPELGNRQVLEGFDDDDQPILRPAVGEITLRHLLTHTSGFVYHIWNQPMAKYLEITGTPPIMSGMNAALDLPLAFDPGTQWDYGIGIDWAGKMLEAVTGQTLGEYMRENLFEPLGMDSTAFQPSDNMISRMAQIHVRSEDGGLAPLAAPDVAPEPEFEAGGSALFSTADDFAKFIRMILNQGMSGDLQVLKPKTVEQMSVNQMGDCRVCLLKSAAPPFSNDFEIFPGLEKSWGLTFLINEADAPTGRPAGSLFWAGLTNCYFWIDPKNVIGGVYLMQMRPFADTQSLDLFLSFEKTVYDNLP